MITSTEENKLFKDQWLPDCHRQWQASASDMKSSHREIRNVQYTISEDRVHCFMSGELEEQKTILSHFGKSEMPFKRELDPVIREQI